MLDPKRWLNSWFSTNYDPNYESKKRRPVASPFSITDKGYIVPILDFDNISFYSTFSSTLRSYLNEEFISGVVAHIKEGAPNDSSSIGCLVSVAAQYRSKVLSEEEIRQGRVLSEKEKGKKIVIYNPDFSMKRLIEVSNLESTLVLLPNLKINYYEYGSKSEKATKAG